MNTQTFVIPKEKLLAMVNAPDGSKVEHTGPTTGTERGKTDGVFIVISSEETESKAMDRRTDLDEQPEEPRSPQHDAPEPADDTNPGDVPSPGKNPPPPPPLGS